jgi:hypothetical protein
MSRSVKMLVCYYRVLLGLAGCLSLVRYILPSRVVSEGFSLWSRVLAKDR